MDTTFHVVAGLLTAPPGRPKVSSVVAGLLTAPPARPKVSSVVAGLLTAPPARPEVSNPNASYCEWETLRSQDWLGRETGQNVPLEGMLALADVAGTNPSTGTYRYYAQDHLGSLRALFAGNKAWMAVAEYEPYGMFRGGAGPADVPGQLFTGKMLDLETGLYYFPYRYYSPPTARWLTRDPLGMVDGPNVYAYVGGNPANAADPLGAWLINPNGDPSTQIGCAIQKLWQAYREMKRANWIGADKYFHCKGNCEAAKCGDAGAGMAAVISWLREIYGRWWKGDPVYDMLADMEANSWGSECPDDMDCGDRCRKYRPAGLPAEY